MNIITPNLGQSMRKPPAVTRKARAREVQKNVSWQQVAKKHSGVQSDGVNWE